MQQNKPNYQSFLLKKIEEIKKDGKKPSLLLHVCCGPCSTTCLEILAEYFVVTALFYNPNIHPEKEYLKRYDELKKFIKIKNQNLKDKIKIKEVDYDCELYFEKIKGLENEKEGGKRCEKCFELRLEKTAQLCKKDKFDYFTTTLTVSPYKNSNLLNNIGNSLAEKYNIKFLNSDFKKNDGYKKSILISKQFDLYRQEYCGCIYSLKERENYIKKQKND